MRFAVDTGGTFTDLVVEDDGGNTEWFKSPTTVEQPLDGVMNVLQLAAQHRGETLQEMLGRGSLFIHGTTRAINAVVTGSTAKTALLTTAGHPDILVFREGGRVSPFDYTQPYPDPYIPRALTFEVPERVDAQGEVVTPLDEAAVVEVIGQLRSEGVEAVAVCLMWSMLRGDHELRIGELLDEHLPGVPYTLSHQINPIIREYRRASSTVIDASLKPVMTEYLSHLEQRLRDAAFPGRVLVVSSGGGMLDAADAARAPIHTLNSGPAMAPVAGQYYAAVDTGADNAIIADTGGTTYDLSLVRNNRIPRSQETWIGPRLLGHMTGFPSVDVKSVGAGGGSIAWVDDGGLLHVGPQSAGAQPGPVCYGRGGDRPTVTDASLVLGYIDPKYFLGGAMKLDTDAAYAVITRDLAEPLGIDTIEAAAATMTLATEKMVHAIEDITVNQGIDPTTAVLVGGGGAAGLNTVAVARRLGCSRVIIPRVGAVFSAAGALMSDLMSESSRTEVTDSSAFDFDAVGAALSALKAHADAFIAGAGQDALSSRVEYFVDARYNHQIWELEVPVATSKIETDQDVRDLVNVFHETHDQVFAIRDDDAPVEFLTWRVRVYCTLSQHALGSVLTEEPELANTDRRSAYFAETGWVDARVLPFSAVPRTRDGRHLIGPALIESPHTTVVINPGAQAQLTDSGSILIDL